VVEKPVLEKHLEATMPPVNVPMPLLELIE